MTESANKGKLNKLSQSAYEKKMQAWADGIKNKTEKMAKGKAKAWDGEPKDVPAAEVEKGEKL